MKEEEKKEEKNTNQNINNTVTVATFLNREEIDFVDKVGKDCFFNFGHKISRGKILAELVDLFMRLKINLKDINFENESLGEGIARLIKDAQSKKS